MYQVSLRLEPEVELDKSVVMLGDPRWDDAIAYWKRTKVFGFDIETYGPNGGGLNPWQGEIRLISIGLLNGLSIVVDLGGFNDNRARIVTKVRFSGFFQVLEERLSNPDVQVVGANLKFDSLWMLVKFGVQLRCVRDVMLLSQLYWAGLSSYRHNLKAIASRLGIAVDKTEQSSDWSWDLTNAQLNYSAKDSLVVLDIWIALGAKLKEEGLQGSAMAECGALPAFTMMEFYGMPVDIDHLNNVLEQYEAASGGVLQPFTDEFPGINPDSPKKVVDAVNARYGLSLESSDQDALAKHWDKPALKSLSLWRSITTYIDYLKGCKAAYFDGSVRGAYRQSAPKGFGRSTCGDKDPNRRSFPNVNLQNPPNPGNLPPELKALGLPAVRTIFKPPAGYKLLVADLSQAHARIATEASMDQTLVDAYLNGKDVHAITASKLAMLQGLGEDWTPDAIAKWRKSKGHENQALAEKLRQAAKPTFYGSLNGQGWRTLQRTAKTDAGVDMADEEAQQAIQAWRDAYSGLYQFQQDIASLANQTEHSFTDLNGKFGEVRGLSGRRIFMQKWGSDYRPDSPPSVKFTDAISFFWTSTEADVIKLAMSGILKGIDDHPEWGAYIANMAHDELDVVCKEEYAPEVARFVQVQMQGAMRLFIKTIPVDEMGAKPENLICNSWADK